MTAPSYTEDLTDLDLADGSTGWAESSDGNWDDQGPPAYQDQDYPYIQGSYAVTADCTKTGRGTLISSNYGAFTVPTDGAILVWINFSSPLILDSYANGGLGIVIGDGLGAFYNYDVGGNDYGSYPYGGWQNFAVNPNTATASDTVGSPTGTWSYFGASVLTTAGISKGEVFQVDAIRGGRCSAIFEYGDASNGYCTIAGFATQNDSSSNRWGLIQVVPGGYLWKGRMQLGTATNAVDFRDSNRLIFVQDTPHVSANFNTIEVVNASSNVEMTGFQFICLAPSNTNSKGRWITTNDATVALTTCTFIDLSTFTFDSNTTALSCEWRRCGQIDPGGGDLSYSFINKSSVTGGGSAGGGALLWNDSADPNTYINDSTFIKGAGSHHAIEFGTSAPTTINFTNMTFTDFSTSNQQTTSVLYFPDTGSDTTWTVAHSGTTGTVSYYKARTGDTVTISSSVPIVITVKDQDGNLLSNVQTAVYLTTDTTYTSPIMNEDTVSGVASENYTGSTPVDVVVRCRKASAGATKYKNYSSLQNIGVSGLTLSVTMVEDPNNNATT